MPQEPSITFKEFTANISGLIAETGVNAIKDLSEEIAEEIEAFYYAFFIELYKILSDANLRTPSRFLGNMGEAGAWQPLSEAWSDKKISSGGNEAFYFGLTPQLNKARRRALEVRRKRGKNVAPARQRKTFIEFLGIVSGNSRSNVEKFFGPVGLTYNIQAKGRKTPIKMTQKENAISELGRITSHNEFGRMISNYANVTLNSEISMFPLLKTADAFSEWFVVDQMARMDSGNRRQWAKINSRFGHKKSSRPIRPIITPLISWYATTGLTQIMRKFYQ